MRRFPLLLLALVAALVCALPIFLDHHRQQENLEMTLHAVPAESALPKTVAWVWERPEDLRSLRPQTEAAAVYEGTLTLNTGAQFTPRRNPVILPEHIQRIATVRIETGPDFGQHHNDSTLLKSAAAALVTASHQPGIAALQIDFDARRSEHVFYRNLLTEVRTSMPPTLPLEITALVSWCSEDDWLRTLPINAAVPMFFRMEPGRARAARIATPSAQLPEPLCNTTVGVSTHEPWPTDIANRRIYVFPDRGWKQDLTLLAELEEPPNRVPQVREAHLGIRPQGQTNTTGGAPGLDSGTWAERQSRSLRAEARSTSTPSTLQRRQPPQ